MKQNKPGRINPGGDVKNQNRSGDPQRSHADDHSSQPTILRGVSTISFYAEDVKAARDWYSSLLGMRPYFERPDDVNPEYIEFRVGDYQHELGIISRKYQPQDASKELGGVVVFWHVDDIEVALNKVKEMGAREYEPLIKREAGFVTASVIDPFGNILGLMYNPHYIEILASHQGRMMLTDESRK